MTTLPPQLTHLLEEIRMWNDSCKFGPHPEHGELINIRVPPTTTKIDAVLESARLLGVAVKALNRLKADQTMFIDVQQKIVRAALTEITTSLAKLFPSES